MKIIKMLCKILMVPFVLLLILFTAMIKFLFSVGSFLLTAASVVLVVLGIALFLRLPHWAELCFCSFAFLLSPFGLQAVADFLIEVLDGGKKRSVQISGRLNTSGQPDPK